MEQGNVLLVNITERWTQKAVYNGIQHLHNLKQLLIIGFIAKGRINILTSSERLGRSDGWNDWLIGDYVMSHKKPKSPFEVVPGPIILNSHCWKGVSAFLLDDITGHCVVISCPDEEQLKFFWNELAQDKLNMSMTQVTVGDYGSHSKEPVVRDTPKPSKFKVGEVPDNDNLIWLYHPGSNCAFLGVKGELSDVTNDLSELGPAIQKTEIECRNILLRKLKWRPEAVDKITVHVNIEPTNKGV